MKPSVPAHWTRGEVIADAIERAAIMEHDGGRPRAYVDAFVASQYGLRVEDLAGAKQPPERQQ